MSGRRTKQENERERARKSAWWWGERWRRVRGLGVPAAGTACGESPSRAAWGVDVGTVQRACLQGTGSSASPFRDGKQFLFIQNNKKKLIKPQSGAELFSSTSSRLCLGNSQAWPGCCEGGGIMARVRSELFGCCCVVRGCRALPGSRRGQRRPGPARGRPAGGTRRWRRNGPSSPGARRWRTCSPSRCSTASPSRARAGIRRR